jgi:hypothetical protein
MSANGKGEWPTAVQVRQWLDLPRHAIDKLTKDGVLQRKQDERGIWRWDPVSIERYLAAEQEDAQKEPEEDPIGTAYRDQTAALRAAQSHVESLLRLVTTPAQDQLRLLQDDLARARARIAELESRFDGMIEAREALLSQAQERELAAAEAAQRSARKDRLLKLAENRALPLLDKYLQSGKADVAMRLLESLEPTMVQALATSGLLKPDQLELLKQLLPDAEGPIDGA